MFHEDLVKPSISLNQFSLILVLRSFFQMVTSYTWCKASFYLKFLKVLFLLKALVQVLEEFVVLKLEVVVLPPQPAQVPFFPQLFQF